MFTTYTYVHNVFAMFRSNYSSARKRHNAGTMRIAYVQVCVRGFGFSTIASSKQRFYIVLAYRESVKKCNISRIQNLA